MDVDAPAVRGLSDDAAFGGISAPDSAAALSYLEPAFALAESALEFYDLTDAEVDAVARIGLQSNGFHPIIGSALPAGSDEEVLEQDTATEETHTEWRERLGALRGRGWQLAACAAIAVAAIGIPAAYSVGWNAALDSSGGGSSQVEEAGPGETPMEEAPVEGTPDGAADRVPAGEVNPITVSPVETEPTEELNRLADINVGPGTSRVLDVPLVNQLDDSNGGRSLWAGCEVASLSMVLRHAGIDVSKEELQDVIPTVPMIDENGLSGNPNSAFVGDMGGDWYGMGYSVYHGPVAELAKRYTADRPLEVVDLTGQSFTTLLKEIADGNPCWVITTTTMTPELVEEFWETPDGTVTINWAVHSVVLTGYDDTSVFINDPYADEPNNAYNRDDFERAWKLMGSQAIAVVPAK